MSQSTQLDGDRRWSRPVLQFLLLIALLCAAVSSAAQVDEVAAGAGGNAVLRGPWVTSGWRKPVPRLALFLLGSLVYERFVDHSGWNWSDFNQRLASYLLAEAAVTGARRFERKRVSAPPTGLALIRDPWCLGGAGRGTLARIVPQPIAADSVCGVPLRR
ncbi:MAG: hypothetical protein DMD44_14510 [Gemmatimonadetes bacterium]|nr:MAG: hypothetical protein DMD44_14510 [Gemmatimonadota bacterium]